MRERKPEDRTRRKCTVEVKMEKFRRRIRMGMGIVKLISEQGCPLELLLRGNEVGQQVED